VKAKMTQPKEIRRTLKPIVMNQMKMRRKAEDKANHTLKMPGKSEDFQISHHFFNFQGESFQT
jgi:hypothetical protein